MTEGPVTISDWIQFLISQKHYCHAWLIGYTTFLVALFSLIMLIIFALGTSIGILVSIPIFILYIWVLYQAFSLRPILKNSKTLLEDILKENMTIVKQIKEKWFDEEEKSMKKWKIFSIGTILIGAIFLIVGYWRDATIVRDFGFLFIPIGIAFYAIHISEESELKLVALGQRSNTRLRTISQATFMEIVDIFEDKRIQLLQHPDWLGVEGTIWKCRTYVERALSLCRATNIQPELRHRLFEMFDYLIYKTCLPWDNEGNTYDAFICDGTGKLTTKKTHHIFKSADINNLTLIVGYFRAMQLNSTDLGDLDKIEEKIETFKKKKKWVKSQ